MYQSIFFEFIASILEADAVYFNVRCFDGDLIVSQQETPPPWGRLQGLGMHTSLQRSEKLQGAPTFSTSKSNPSRWKSWCLCRTSMNTILRRSMSRFTIANLPRMEVAALSQELLALKSPDNSVAVIDVRDGGMQIQWLHPSLDAPLWQ